MAISSDQMIDFELVLFDEALDVFAARAGLRACVCYGATEPYIVPDEVLA
ncbi:MAG TPA: hypothetical protein VJN70_04895 [Gemmatimonadaceae bacterium]|nr:hypothetical protein [Gemmatimonadaceae bacterium]